MAGRTERLAAADAAERDSHTSIHHSAPMMRKMYPSPFPCKHATWFTCIAQIPLGSARHVSTRHVRRVEPMHFVCVELVEQHGSTRSSRRARHVERVVSCRDVTSQMEVGLISLHSRADKYFSVAGERICRVFFNYCRTLPLSYIIDQRRISFMKKAQNCDIALYTTLLPWIIVLVNSCLSILLTIP